VHIRNFKNENKVTFNVYSNFERNNVLVVDFIFYLNDHFTFNGVDFDELPVKYVISSLSLKIYVIWFDDSFKTRLEEQWNLFCRKRAIHKVNLNCLPFSVLSDPFINDLRKMFFNDFVINTITMEIEIKETSKNYEKLKK
jgi:hypothetical protein